MWRKAEIEGRLRGRPHLMPVYNHVSNIPERLRENDRNLFVVFNALTQKYEIHSLENKGSSFSLNVPFKDLDSRIETFVKKYDLRRHGKKIFQEFERREEERERAQERDRQNRARNLADVLHKPVRRLAWYGE